MTNRRPDDDGAPEGPDGVPPASEDFWLEFLTDSEHAIRSSAPREPSARERALGRHAQAPAAGGTEPWTHPARHGPRTPRTDAVGDLWQPEDPWPGPSWRDLDNRARVRRIGRAVVTAAALTLTLVAWSWLSTTGGTPGGVPEDVMVQQSEQAPRPLPTG